MIYRTEDSFGYNPAEECWLSEELEKVDSLIEALPGPHGWIREFLASLTLWCIYG